MLHLFPLLLYCNFPCRKRSVLFWPIQSKYYLKNIVLQDILVAYQCCYTSSELFVRTRSSLIYLYWCSQNVPWGGFVDFEVLCVHVNRALLLQVMWCFIFERHGLWWYRDLPYNQLTGSAPEFTSMVRLQSLQATRLIWSSHQYTGVHHEPSSWLFLVRSGVLQGEFYLTCMSISGCSDW